MILHQKELTAKPALARGAGLRSIADMATEATPTARSTIPRSEAAFARARERREFAGACV